MTRFRLPLTATLLLLSSACASKSEEAPAAETTAAPAIPAALVGTWASETRMGEKDSVVATTSMTFGADGSLRTVFTGRTDTLVARILRVTEDSTGVEVEAEVGPYPSAVRPGVEVTTTTVTRFAGTTATGTWTGKYSDGQVLTGKITSTKQP